jgi:circadian clock protein KaiB
MGNKENNMNINKDPKKTLEKAVVDRDRQKYLLRLYISGLTPRSTRAIENLRKICEEYLKDRYELEIIDIFQQTEVARSEQIIAAPTLIKRLPLPLRRFIGDLSDTGRILVGLEIKDKH